MVVSRVASGSAVGWVLTPGSEVISGVASGSAVGAVGTGVVGSDAFLGLVVFTLGLAGVVEG